MSVNRYLLIVLLVFAVTLPATAQRDDILGRGELVLSAGGMNYIGDLNNQSVFSMPHFAFGAGLHERLDNRWAIRIEAFYGNVSCEHDYLERRNLSFRSHIYEGTVVGEFYFRPFGTGATESQWTPYIFGGVGFFMFNPEALYTASDGTEQWVALQPLHTEGQGTSLYLDRRPYALVQLCMPFGVGFRWRMGKSFSLSVEYGFRKTWTDYLDDVSTTYVGSEVLLNSSGDAEMAAEMADRTDEVVPGCENAPGIKRGDDSLDDWYACFNISIGVSLETILGWTRSKRCKL